MMREPVEGKLPPGDGVYVLPGYWRECHLMAANEGYGRRMVASIDVMSPESGVQWIGRALRLLIPSLELGEAQAALEWLHVGTEEALRILRAREAFSLSVVHGVNRVEWSVMPVTFLPLANRLSGSLPPCVDHYPGPLPVR